MPRVGADGAGGSRGRVLRMATKLYGAIGYTCLFINVLALFVLDLKPINILGVIASWFWVSMYEIRREVNRED